MASWFVRTDGSANNSGGGDTAAADINGEGGTDFVVDVDGVSLTYAPGGLSALSANSVGPTGYTRSVNLSIAGTRTIRLLTVTADTTGTLNAAVAAGSYAGSIGGARALPTQATSTAAGNNTQLATGDTIFVRTGTYTTLWILNATGTYFVTALGGVVTIDGTGGGAGSDTVTNSAGTWLVTGILADNAVDAGFIRTGGSINLRFCKALDSGGRGIDGDGNEDILDCCVIGAGGDAGIRGQNGGDLIRCWVSDCTTDGYDSRGSGTVDGCAFIDNGSAGIDCPDGNAARLIRNSIAAGNTASGFEVTGGTPAGRITAGAQFVNNIFASNGTYGLDFNTAQTAAGSIVMIGNCTFGNGTAARNAAPADIEGFVGLTSDPDFVDLTTDDVRLSVGSPHIGSAFAWWPGNNAQNFGGAATEESVAAGGGSGIPGNLLGGLLQ